jgi:hypothetical protein
MIPDDDKFWDETVELTHEEIRDRLIEAGIDPDAMMRRIRLMIKEIIANQSMEKSLHQIYEPQDQTPLGRGPARRNL